MRAYVPCISSVLEVCKLNTRLTNHHTQHMQMWQRDQIVRHVLCNVAVAIQRENAATVLAGHAAIDFSRRGTDKSDDEGATDEDDQEDEQDDEEEAEDNEEDDEQKLNDQDVEQAEEVDEKQAEEQYQVEA